MTAGRGDGVMQESALLLPEAAPEAAFPTQVSPGAVELPQRLTRPSRLLTQAGRLTAGASRRDIASRLEGAIALEWERGTAFLWIPVLLCAGSILYFTIGFEPDLTALAAGFSVAAAVAYLVRARPVLHAAALGTVVVLCGVTAAKLETWRAGTRVVGGEITTRLTGRVVTIEHRANGRFRLTLDVTATARPALRYQPDRVRVTARTIPAGLRPGMAVEGVVRLLPPLGPLRPDSYDFSFKSYFDGIGANGFYLIGPVAASPEPPDRGFGQAVAWAENLRMSLADRIRRHIGGPEGEIAAALVAGVRAGIPEAANEVLRITGLAHILSISGLHMALVAGVFIGGLRAGFALFPIFASRHAVRKYAAVAALIGVTLYLVLSGMAVAAQRSYVMIAVMLIALLFDRAALTMRNLAIAAIVILLISPHEAAGPSFQMSFAATAALIAVYGYWSERKARQAGSQTPPQRSFSGRASRAVLLYAAGLAVTSLIAGLATGVFGAWHFQRVSPLGLLANLAAMPIVAALVMPFAVLAMFLMPFDLDGPAFWVVGQGIGWTLAIAGWLAERSPLDGIGAIPAAAVVLLAIALVIATMTTTALRLAALPFALAGLILIGARELPQLYVSEDARLMGLRLPDGRLAVNRGRPNAFTVSDWSRAMMADSVAPPAKDASLADLLAPDAAGSGFRCFEKLCVARHAGGALVAHAGTMSDAARFCGSAALIVIDDATAANPCPFSPVTVITKRRLAQSGSAEIAFGPTGQILVRHAAPAPHRPWHDHRRFSREARGMPPWQRREDPAQPAADEGAPGDPPPGSGPQGAVQ